MDGRQSWQAANRTVVHNRELRTIKQHSDLNHGREVEQGGIYGIVTALRHFLSAELIIQPH